MKACSAGPDNDGNWTRSDPATQQFLVKETPGHLDIGILTSARFSGLNPPLRPDSAI